MAKPTNVIAFPIIPRNRQISSSTGSVEGFSMTRHFLKDVIDIAYDGLLNNREAEAFERISGLFPNRGVVTR